MTLDPVTFRHAFEAIKDLPTLPVVVGEITKRIANPATNAADIGKLIERDQALTSRVLRLVNSSYYGFPRQIKSIKHAVVILGFSKIKSVVITTAVLRAFKKSRANGFDITRFWQHSLAAAISAKALAETFGIGHAAEEAFIGGLLHDIGKVVMEQFQSAIYSPVLQHARDNGLLLLEAEKQLLGLTHDMVG
ncbi:MAG: HDOD domain-containing protein, partial [Planctomycetes bacterium]|nr:HDOD domain-containing protein [Planctomycetota bacterium]